MRTQSRKSLLLFCTVVLLGLTLAGFALAQPLNAAGALARPQAAPAQETPTGATETVTATTGAEVDHAAHHPDASQAVTGTAALSVTAPVSGSMMGGMMGMMGQMDAMHGSMAADMGELMDKYAESMTPEMAADMGRMMGRMESMSAMMGDMHGMMDKCMAGGMMGDMMQGGMMQGGMMQGGMMGGDMPTGAGTLMTDTMPMTGAMPMTGTMPGMEGMDHGTMANADQPFDAQFIDSMIEHHQGAIEMARIVLEEAEHEELLTMAEAIISAQEAEIAQMQAWRAEWYPDLPATEGTGMAMGEMTIAEDASLAFDRRFLEAMISHHRGAVMMAEAALTQAEQEELREMAEAIIAAQEAEISQMEQWLLEWYDVEAQAAPAGMQGSMTGMTAMMHGMHADMGSMMEGMPQDMAKRMEAMQARMGSMMPMMEGMQAGAMISGTMPMSGGMMGDMGAMREEMGAMHEEMQAMMDEMMAGDSDMMTPEMAAQMGRMMGRMEGMSGMMGMMSGGMMECPMMGGMMEDSD